MEERIDSHRPFEGRLLSVRVDRVRLPSGRESVREVVEHPGAVGILPVLEDGRLLLIRQYRYAVDRELLEIPAGTMEPGESAEECALREVEEETGTRAGRIQHLATYFVSPGWCNEQMVIYRAWDLQDSTVSPEDDEVIDVVPVSPDDISGLIQSGQIADAKTITALMMHLGNA
jgi:ADP-ribose pyrophosphatase